MAMKFVDDDDDDDVISLICWSLPCICLLNQIYLKLTTLYRLKIPLWLI